MLSTFVAPTVIKCHCLWFQMLLLVEVETKMRFNKLIQISFRTKQMFLFLLWYIYVEEERNKHPFFAVCFGLTLLWPVECCLLVCYLADKWARRCETVFQEHLLLILLCILFFLFGKWVNWTLFDWKALFLWKAKHFQRCMCNVYAFCLLFYYHLLLLIFSFQFTISVVPFVIVSYECKQFCYGPFAVDDLNRVEWKWNFFRLFKPLLRLLKLFLITTIDNRQ